jgi:zinc protease
MLWSLLIRAMCAAQAGVDPLVVAESLRWPAQEARLDNGLRVVVIEDHRAPLVAVHLRHGVGASADPPGQAGLAHLLEHLMFEGSPQAPEGAYDRWLAEVGGENNAWTDHDAVAFHFVAPREALELGLFLEADRMGALDLQPADLTNQVGVVLGEQAAAEAEAHGLDREGIDAAMWPDGHPWHRPVLGREAELQGLGLAQVLDFHRRHLGPEQALLVIVGDVQAEEALELARRCFGPLQPRGARPAPVVPALPLGEDRRVAATDQLSGATLYAVWRTVPAGHKDELALDLLADLLSSGRGSRLDDALYYDRRRVHDLAAWTSNGRHGGLFVVELHHDRRDLDRLLPLLDRELQRLRSRPPSSAELARQRLRWLSWHARAWSALPDRAEAVADCLSLGRPPNCLADQVAQLQHIDVADLERVLVQYLRPQGRLLYSMVSAEHPRRALRGSSFAQVQP